MTKDSIHTFSWNGISFDTPSDWNLSDHHAFRGVTSISMEDDVALRLEVEWTTPKTEIDLDTIRRRYAKAARNLVALADESSTINSIPDGWSAVRYRMPEDRELLIAYYFCPRTRLFCFFQFHFNSDSMPRPLKALKIVSGSFHVEEGPVIPWRFYDVNFALDSDFHLNLSSLHAGNKLMVFEWKLRRLFVWHISLVDHILKRTSLQDWIIAHLHGFKPIRAVKFSLTPDNTIKATRRKWRYPLGQYEEIGRQCFHYYANYRHIKEKNQIAIWLLQYRKPDDLKKLQSSFRIPGCEVARFW